jgi:hypothetical protein
MRLKQIENKEIEVLPPRVIKTYAIIESDDEQVVFGNPSIIELMERL